MLSVTCKAAIKAVIYIGSQKDANAKSSIKEIAQYIDENEHTVGKLLQKLVKENIINSVKGPNGGFYITDKQKEKKIIVIVHAIDGDEVFNQCGLGLSKCSASHPCPIHDDYKVIRDSFKQLCNRRKISELCEAINDNLAYLINIQV